MKKILALSLCANAALLGAFLWTRAEHRAEVDRIASASMRNDEFHTRLHARSLAALEGSDPEGSEETSELLSIYVEAGERNARFRREVGFLE